MPPATTSRQGPRGSGATTTTIPASFHARKEKILSELRRPDDDYADKSPKGSVDIQIRDLIEEINRLDGYVTTSSCAGRVAVFLEGGETSSLAAGRVADEDSAADFAGESETLPLTEESGVVVKTSPGGKGGGRWLYVSHDPVPESPTASQDNGDVQLAGYFTDLFQLSATPLKIDPKTSSLVSNDTTQVQRLIHLSFSPLILHIHCATLSHARPLLAAAINSGFRESGVQSLRILDDPEAGVMLAIRTAGLAFETVVGTMEGEKVGSIVSEDYLQLCVKVVNERFNWNEVRRERLRAEMRRFTEKQEADRAWEDQDERRRRKREEGLRRQRDKANIEATAVQRRDYGEQDADSMAAGLATLHMT